MTSSSTLPRSQIRIPTPRWRLRRCRCHSACGYAAGQADIMFALPALSPSLLMSRPTHSGLALLSAVAVSWNPAASFHTTRALPSASSSIAHPRARQHPFHSNLLAHASQFQSLAQRCRTWGSAIRSGAAAPSSCGTALSKKSSWASSGRA